MFDCNTELRNIIPVRQNNQQIDQCNQISNDLVDRARNSVIRSRFDD